MKVIALQDNLSKTKAVQDVFQQMLRFPDEVQQSLAGQLQRERQLRERSVNKSEETAQGKLKLRRKSEKERNTFDRDRRENPEEPKESADEWTERQCCIDLRV